MNGRIIVPSTNSTRYGQHIHCKIWVWEVATLGMVTVGVERNVIVKTSMGVPPRVISERTFLSTLVFIFIVQHMSLETLPAERGSAVDRFSTVSWPPKPSQR